MNREFRPMKRLKKRKLGAKPKPAPKHLYEQYERLSACEDAYEQYERMSACEDATSKTCRRCNQTKDLSEFFKDYRAMHSEEMILLESCFVSFCSSCATKKEKVSLKNKERYYEKDGKENHKKYIDKFKERNPDYSRKYYKENQERMSSQITAAQNKRRKEDPLFRFKEDIRSLIRQSVKGRGYKKGSRTEEILGCSFEFFRDYIEAQFEDWMTWDNHGEWHYDHIIPMASASTEEAVIRLNHYTNFQPLSAADNLSKGSKLNWVKKL